MFAFFETFFDLISSVVSMFVRSAFSTVQLFITAAEGLVFANVVFNFMPGFLSTILSSLLGLAIVKFVLNFGRS